MRSAARRAARRQPAAGDGRADVGARARPAWPQAPPKLVKPITTAPPGPVADERAAGVALAGVAAALRHARAEHARGVVAVAVGLARSALSGSMSITVWRRASGKSPAADAVVEPQPSAVAVAPATAARAVVELRDAADRARELEQREVVRERVGVEARMDAHAHDVHARARGARAGAACRRRCRARACAGAPSRRSRRSARPS